MISQRTEMILIVSAVAVFLMGYGWFYHTVSKLEPLSVSALSEQTSPITLAVVPTGSAGRIQMALELMDVSPDLRVLITGLYPRVTQNDLAHSYGEVWQRHVDRITLGYRAKDTYGNALETQNWLNTSVQNLDSKTLLPNIHIITSPLHMPRTLMIFHAVLGDKAHLDPLLSPHAASVHPWPVLREYVKYLLTGAYLLLPDFVRAL